MRKEIQKLSESRRFSRFISTFIYKLLNRNSTSIQTQESTKLHNECAEFIHLLTKSVSTIISLSVVIYSLKLVERIGRVGNRKTAKGSEPYLFAVALIIAQKVVEDKPYANKCWVKLLNMPVDHINLLEREFLSCIQFDVSVPLDEFNTWFSNIQRSAKKFDTTLLLSVKVDNKVESGLYSPPLSPYSSQ